eukprot:TRINITY_DN303382_c0_g1_i1.p1 TRINITY_DN303382_c0_g1~~TRINITY_DN303382_c0_g1_i1.p1  ORF type:complete len:815 (-),score=315.34 TRINITY_DN303382_c0_g1_i1:174-2582(-)
MFSQDKRADQTSSSEIQEQEKHLKKLIDLLIVAGYFRARVNALTPFDKVVGGLCWCIISSGISVDVDIFYDDELPLGHKIKLCENICKVLRRMRCPFPLLPNQIRGYGRGGFGADYAAIAPVIQWLITKVIEARKNTGDFVRQGSIKQYQKKYSWDVKKTDPSEMLIRGVKEANPKRQFKRSAALWEQDLSVDALVQSCLLEFGETVEKRKSNHSSDEPQQQLDEQDEKLLKEAYSELGANVQPSQSEFEQQMSRMQKAAAEEEELALKAAAKRQKKILTHMSEGGNVTSMSGAKVVGLVEGDAIREQEESYARASERAKAEVDRVMQGTRLGLIAQHKRECGVLQTQIEELQGMLSVLTEKKDDLNKRIDEENEGVKIIESEIVATKAALEKIQRYESSGKASEDDVKKVKTLKSLITKNDELKQESIDFKKSCRENRDILQDKIKELTENFEKSSTKFAGIKETHAKFVHTRDRLLSLLSKKRRRFAMLCRVADDIPTRGELIQYERRLGELHGELGQKLDENRIHVSTYNTLHEKFNLLKQQDDLLVRVAEFAPKGVKVKSNRQALVKNLTTYIERLKSNLSEQAGLREQVFSERSKQELEFQSLQEKNRSYIKAVRDFQEACDLNVQLLKELEKLENGEQVEEKSIEDITSNTSAHFASDEPATEEIESLLQDLNVNEGALTLQEVSVLVPSSPSKENEIKPENEAKETVVEEAMDESSFADVSHNQDTNIAEDEETEQFKEIMAIKTEEESTIESPIAVEDEIDPLTGEIVLTAKEVVPVQPRAVAREELPDMISPL